jgi:hypothetical protein
MAKKNNAQKAAAPKTSFKSAGVNGNISKNEALKIAESKNISVAKVMDRALGKGLTIGASLVNKYNSGKLDDRNYIQKATDNVFLGMGGKSQYQPQSLNKLNTFGQMSKGSVYGGMTSTGTPVLDMKRPKTSTAVTTRIDDPKVVTDPKTTDPVVTDPIYEEPVIPPEKEEKLDPIAINGGTGSSVDGGATSFRRKKSSARTAGLTTRGPGQFRNSLKVGSASGVNIGM